MGFCERMYKDRNDQLPSIKYILPIPKIHKQNLDLF